ncbi:hypothetical protein PR048_006935 [Dryococelus australis]|uniref:Uncharacterized protein n=1 Tax=Dryococelus australis TaxID=614101 RepID=A0ABQ9ICA8_9NEOP|nr:hypothetical protein PR048_006935 [Dryococelus australis]
MPYALSTPQIKYKICDANYGENSCVETSGSATIYCDVNGRSPAVEYPRRWIGRGGLVPWPARSPDLSPSDFFFWGCLKRRVYSGWRPDTWGQLLQATTSDNAPCHIQDPVNSPYFQEIYVKTHNRAAPYFAGVIVGIIIFKKRSSKFKFGKQGMAKRRNERSREAGYAGENPSDQRPHPARFSRAQNPGVTPTGVGLGVSEVRVPQVTSHVFALLVWTLASATMLAVYVFFDQLRPRGTVEAALYSSLHRVGFGVAIACYFLLIAFGQLGEFVLQARFKRMPQLRRSIISKPNNTRARLSNQINRGSVKLVYHIFIKVQCDHHERLENEVPPAASCEETTNLQARPNVKHVHVGGSNVPTNGMPKVSQYNVRMWGQEHPHETTEHERASPKVNVFCTVSKDTVCFFHEPTVTGIPYLGILTDWLFPQLEEAAGDFIFQPLVVVALNIYEHMIWNYFPSIITNVTGRMSLSTRVKIYAGRDAGADWELPICRWLLLQEYVAYKQLFHFFMLKSSTKETFPVQSLFARIRSSRATTEILHAMRVKAVHDKVSTFEINLRKKSLPLRSYILTDALRDMNPVNASGSKLSMDIFCFVIVPQMSEFDDVAAVETARCEYQPAFCAAYIARRGPAWASDSGAASERHTASVQGRFPAGLNFSIRLSRRTWSSVGGFHRGTPVFPPALVRLRHPGFLSDVGHVRAPALKPFTQRRIAKAEETGHPVKPPPPPVDQRHRPAQVPHVKIREPPSRESNPLRVQGQEARERYGRQLHARLASHRSYAQGVQCFRRIYESIFSWKPFKVLSRLTYGAYLVHTLGQLYDHGSLRSPRPTAYFTVVSNTLPACGGFRQTKIVDAAVLATRPLVLREYVYVDALGRLGIYFTFPVPPHSIIWRFMGIAGLLLRENPNAHYYRQFLETDLPLLLEDVLLEGRRGIWSWQDREHPNFIRAVAEVLNAEHPGRWPSPMADASGREVGHTGSQLIWVTTDATTKLADELAGMQWQKVMAQCVAAGLRSVAAHFEQLA